MIAFLHQVALWVETGAIQAGHEGHANWDPSEPMTRPDYGTACYNGFLGSVESVMAQQGLLGYRF